MCVFLYNHICIPLPPEEITQTSETQLNRYLAEKSATVFLSKRPQMIGLKRKKTLITDSPYACLLTTPPNDLLFNMVQWLHYDETVHFSL